MVGGLRLGFPSPPVRPTLLLPVLPTLSNPPATPYIPKQPLNLGMSFSPASSSSLLVRIALPRPSQRAFSSSSRSYALPPDPHQPFPKMARPRRAGAMDRMNPIDRQSLLLVSLPFFEALLEEQATFGPAELNPRGTGGLTS